MRSRRRWGRLPLLFCASGPEGVSDQRTTGISMDRIRIVGGNKLNGTIAISGAKNAALPLMIAALLTDETLILDNVPRLADVAQLQRILGNHGVDIMSLGKRPGDRAYQGQTLHISAANIIDTTAPYELVSRMRASAPTSSVQSTFCATARASNAA